MEILLTYSGDTGWPRGYDEEEFQDIRMGAKEGEVRKYAGSPSDTMSHADGRQAWLYTKPKEQGRPYFLRVVRFDPRGVVIAKVSEYRRDGLPPQQAEDAAAKRARAK